MGDFKFSVDLTVTENGRRAPEYTLETDLDGEITLKDLVAFFKASLIIITDQTLREEQALGFDKNPIITVDGSSSKSISEVNPFGTIQINSRVSIDQMLIDTYVSLLDRSPVLTGRYQSSHHVLLNGTQVAANLGQLSDWLSSNPEFTDKDEIMFIDIQPYARKLERLGVTSQRTKSRFARSRDKKFRSGAKVLVPNGTYYLTYRAIKRKYQRNSSIGFGFISGARLGLNDKESQHYFKTKRKSEKAARTYLYPVISITVDENGIANV